MGIETILLISCCVLPFINVGIACYTNSKCDEWGVQTTIGEMCIIFVLSIIPIVGFLCMFILFCFYMTSCCSDFFNYKPFAKRLYDR